MPSMHRGEARAVREIAAHLLVERVVVEQVVTFQEYRVGLVGQFRHTGKDIFGRVAVDEHGMRSFARLPHRCRRAFYHLRATRLPMIPGSMLSISQCQLVLFCAAKWVGAR